MGGKTKTVGRDVTVEEVMEEVMKDAPYYRRSGGGLTLSGGETLYQPDFAEALLRTAKEYGLHTAIESTAFAPFETIERLLPYLDLYLLDIKHIDPVKHEKFIGRPNELVLENAQKIARFPSTRLIVRVPTVPTFNDTPEEIGSIARFASGLPGVEEIHLLPYHRLGQDKYEGLGRAYSLDRIAPPTKDLMETLRLEAEKYGLRAQIGG